MKAPKVTAHRLQERPRVNGLDAMLFLSLGFSIQPFVEAIAHRDVFRIIVGIAFFVIVYRRITPRLGDSPAQRKL